MESAFPDEASDRAEASLFDAPTPLESVIGRLQGDVDDAQIDPGIAGFDRDCLDRIADCAGQERDACNERINCLLKLLDVAACGDRALLPDTLVVATVQQVLRLLRDARRWSVLAENASYYRTHPEIAVHIAAFVARYDPA